jgi:DNA-binding HxlR family transcriptional regulator
MLPADRGVTYMNVRKGVPGNQDMCAVEVTVAVIGGKWKPIIMFHLVSGEKRFSDLKRLLPQTSDRMLTRSLRELEQDELIKREIMAEVPVRVTYSLTDDGTSLIPVLNAMSDWGIARSVR